MITPEETQDLPPAPVAEELSSEPVCKTCSDHGWIGGPTYAQPDDPGERCPDCNRSGYGFDAAAHAYVVNGECEEIMWGTNGMLTDDEALVLLYTHPQPAVPEVVENLKARIKELEHIVSAMLDTGAVRLIPGEPGAVAINNPVCISNEDAAAVVRAFWRRIYPYVYSENDPPYPREFGDELPVEFQAHMATALCALPEPSAALTMPAIDVDTLALMLWENDRLVSSIHTRVEAERIATIICNWIEEQKQ